MVAINSSALHSVNSPIGSSNNGCNHLSNNKQDFRASSFIGEDVGFIPGLGAACVRTHFGEILQGQFSFDGTLRRALVTLPCPIYYARAVFEANRTGLVTVEPSRCLKSQKAARLALKHLHRSRWGGHLRLYSNIPEGVGAGSSSGDVVATIRAVAHAFGASIDDKSIARLAVMAEIAADSIMFDKGHAVLFAQRDGEMLEMLGALPKLLALGITDGTTVDTLAHPPAIYNEVELSMLAELHEHLKKAVASGSSQEIANVSTASALLNQRHLPKPNMNKFLELIPQVGALGLAVSHSGSAVAFLFDGANSRAADQMCDLSDRLRHTGIRNAFRFEPSCTPRHYSSKRSA